MKKFLILLLLIAPISAFACCQPTLTKEDACKYWNGIIPWYGLDINWINKSASSNGPVLKNSHFLYYPVYTNKDGESPYLYSWDCKIKKSRQILSSKISKSIFNFFGSKDGVLDPSSINKFGHLMLLDGPNVIEVDMKNRKVILTNPDRDEKIIKY